MNREILFRGKRIDNGEWVEGYFCPCSFGRFPCKPAIISTEKLEQGAWEPVKVDLATVGQYTGLTDKNGKKIFEGDVVTDCEYGGVYSVRYFGDNEYPAFDVSPELETVECNGLSFLSNVNCLEVIGNIHDNPELLEGEQT